MCFLHHSCAPSALPRRTRFPLQAMTFAEQVKALNLSKGESHLDALQCMFLKLNRLTHDHLFSAYATNASRRRLVIDLWALFLA